VGRGHWAADPAPNAAASAARAAWLTSLNVDYDQLEGLFAWDPVPDRVKPRPKRLVSTHFARRGGGPASGIKVQVFHKQYSEKTI
tara:strand:+ start:279 stop:533 length:255 start_codon:yes stop_codon:yes gene_type:complete